MTPAQNRQLRHLARWLLISLGVSLVSGLALMIALLASGPRTYPCDMAEISPDYPQQIKEQCRKARRITT